MARKGELKAIAGIARYELDIVAALSSAAELARNALLGKPVEHVNMLSA
ncbi:MULTISPECIES: hypothetical protein [unclassified Adlercreutzia]|nr:MULTISPECIES: hypothetical protein [unclassified Adlercreutzia]